MGCNALVKLAHCQQISHHTPTGTAEHSGVEAPTRYLTSACVTPREKELQQISHRTSVPISHHQTPHGWHNTKTRQCRKRKPSQPPAGRAEQCPQTFHSRWWFPAPGLLCSYWTMEIQCSYWIGTERRRGPSLDTVLRAETERVHRVTENQHKVTKAMRHLAVSGIQFSLSNH